MTATPTTDRHWTFAVLTDGTVRYLRDGERRELLSVYFHEAVLDAAAGLHPYLVPRMSKEDIIEALLEALLGDPA